ncbi:asparagine synthase [Breznakibacter xylanolyticus]|uniref:asparagine synthase (glutamine-hydrolyzing) n=1 Tax=Breznakibacter xylanolyticus TaxID=990 RepID=A0A2W7N4J6_9BACT|nr:asparagine synthase-related protein [Breznakibacter xylanolyticus]PZX14988.1 asparagine synthase [Breznakibacter xylanolyticus]
MIFHWKPTEYIFTPDSFTYKTSDGQIWFKGYFTYQEKIYSGIDAVEILHQYALSEPNCNYNQFNGIYSAIFLSNDKKNIKILNDRFGFRPIYYYYCKNELILSDNYWEVCKRLQIINLDEQSILELLKFTYVLEDRSIIKNIFFIQPSTIAHIQLDPSTGCQMHCDTYWNTDYQPSEINIHEASDRIKYLLNKIIQRYQTSLFKPPKKIGINLTGGLDSRVLLSLLVQNQVSPASIIAYTYGHPKADDHKIARTITDHLKIKHHQVLYGDEFYDYFSLEVIDELTNRIGYTNYYSQAYGVNRQTDKYAESDYLITGSDGFIFGNFINLRLLKINTKEELVRYILQSSGQACTDNVLKNGITIQEAEEKIFNQIFQSDTLKCKDTISAYFNWIIKNKPPKFLLSPFELQNEQTCVLLPFYDYEFIDFMLTLPPEILMNQNAYINTAYEKIFIGTEEWMKQIPVEKRGYPKRKSNQIFFLYRNKKIFTRIKKKMWFTIDYSFPFPAFAFFRKDQAACLKRIQKILAGNSAILSTKAIQKSIKRKTRSEHFFNYGLSTILTLLRIEKKIDTLKIDHINTGDAGKK